MADNIHNILDAIDKVGELVTYFYKSHALMDTRKNVLSEINLRDLSGKMLEIIDKGPYRFAAKPEYAKPIVLLRNNNCIDGNSGAQYMCFLLDEVFSSKTINKIVDEYNAKQEKKK
jgi:hypothetical protein